MDRTTLTVSVPHFLRLRTGFDRFDRIANRVLFNRPSGVKAPSPHRTNLVFPMR